MIYLSQILIMVKEEKKETKKNIRKRKKKNKIQWSTLMVILFVVFLIGYRVYAHYSIYSNNLEIDLENPISQYCINSNGTLNIVYDSDNNPTKVCIFDNIAYDAEEFYNQRNNS
jgi:putative hemolysin